MDGGEATGRSPSQTAEEWVAAQGDYLFRSALFRVGDREVARELVQETLLAALESSGFEGRSSARTWLLGILKHKVADHFRRLAREPRGDPPDPENEFFGEDDRWRSPPTPWPSDPSGDLERKRFWEALHSCMAKLPPRRASAFALRELDGLETQELVQALGTTAGSVWVLLHRARLALRRCLEGMGYGPEEEGDR